MNFTQKSHEEVSKFLKTADVVVDATSGGGFDSLFGASLLSESGKIFCFDVQQTAIERTKKRLEQGGYLAKAHFFQIGHEQMSEVLPTDIFGKVNCFFFNLGWLPNSDKQVITKPQTTIKALRSAIELADKSKCILSVLCYKAHDGGMQEFLEVEKFLMSVGEKIERFTDANNPLSPELFVVKFLDAKK